MRVLSLAIALCLSAPALPGQAQDAILPPGLSDAALLPGWVTPDGHRMAALSLVLQPGWKTYWRAPGETGLPAQFDWTASQNVGAVAVHWPAPEVIDSGGARSFGFHDRLVLPVEVTPADPSHPVTLAASVDFGLCREVCVPATLTLTAAPPASTPDRRIEAALAAMPRRVAARPACTITAIADGMRLSALLPAAVTGDVLPAAAVELTGGAEVWVSTPEVSRGADGVTVAAEFVPPSAKPFALDAAAVRLTLLGPDGAVETQGCAG